MILNTFQDKLTFKRECHEYYLVKEYLDLFRQLLVQESYKAYWRLAYFDILDVEHAVEIEESLDFLPPKFKRPIKRRKYNIKKSCSSSFSSLSAQVAKPRFEFFFSFSQAMDTPGSTTCSHIDNKLKLSKDFKQIKHETNSLVCNPLVMPVLYVKRSKLRKLFRKRKRYVKKTMKVNKENFKFISKVPFDVLKHILSYLSYATKFSRVSKKFRRAISEVNQEKVVKLFERVIPHRFSLCLEKTISRHFKNTTKLYAALVRKTFCLLKKKNQEYIVKRFLSGMITPASFVSSVVSKYPSMNISYKIPGT